ncbi:hypothetical protein D3C75_989570 [compost metagenome]
MDWADLSCVFPADCGSPGQDDNGGLQRRIRRLLGIPVPAGGAACAAHDRACCNCGYAAEHLVRNYDGSLSGACQLAEQKAERTAEQHRRSAVRCISGHWGTYDCAAFGTG